MKTRLIALLLLLAMLLSTLSILTGCAETPQTPTPQPDDTPTTDTIPSKFVVPPYKDYDRTTIHFQDITYHRPDIAASVAELASVCLAIQDNELTYEEQLTLIHDAEAGYTDILTMQSLSYVKSCHDAQDTYWSGEYAWISAEYPALTQQIEKLYVAAANSPHAEQFETDYFGDDLIEQYRDGGIYTDEVVDLIAQEATLEAEYNAYSTATVTITCNGRTDTFDNLVAYFATVYGTASDIYTRLYTACQTLYQKKVQELSADLFVRLCQVRRQIADRLGYDSYAEYAYGTLTHDYTPQQAEQLISDIATYVLPVYQQLYYYVFAPLSQTAKEPSLDTAQMVNTLYSVLQKQDSELFDVYSYLLQFGLYDFALSTENRYGGAFTTYLEAYEAPFIFASFDGKLGDYTTLCHEFGHFADAYLNDNASSSLDLAEISSQGLELLMLHALKDVLKESDYRYLFYQEMQNALEVLLYQGLYARFEIMAYALPYEEITRERLDGLAGEAFAAFGFHDESLADLTQFMIPHVVLYPFYVQSYAVSLLPSLELYFAEAACTGAGFEAYKTLLKREDNTLSLEDQLHRAGLSSPFASGQLKAVLNDIYRALTGADFYKTSPSTPNET